MSTMKYRQIIVWALALLLSVVGVQSVSARSFEKGERLYINGTPESASWWKNDCEIWCKLIDGWDTYWIKVEPEWWYSSTVCYIEMPEGAARNWNQLIIARYSPGSSPAYGSGTEYNKTGEINLNATTKNYIQNFAYGSGWTEADWRIITPTPGGKPTGIPGSSWSMAYEDEQICTSAAGTMYILAPKDYDYANSYCHAWFKYHADGDWWERIWGYDYRAEEGDMDNYTTLGDAYSDTYYFYQAAKPSKCRLIRIRLNQDCSDGYSGACKITNFAAVASDANVTDKISAVDGLVAFDDKKNAGDLMIWCDDVDTFIVANDEIVIPQTFKLRGFDAATEKTYTLHAKFLGDGSGTCISTCNVTVAPPETAIETHTINENSPESNKSLTRFTEETITLYPDNQTSDGFMWVNSENEDRITDDPRNHTFTSAVEKDVTYTFIATHDPVVVEPNLIALGGSFESNSGFASNYDYWGNDPEDYYSTHSNASGGYAICSNSTRFSDRYNEVEPHEGSYFGLFDSKVYDGTDQDAWRVEGLSVQSGTSYLFSFWVANINNFGEMNNGAQLQFQISYDNGANYEDIGGEIDLSDYRDNRWHGISSIVTPPATVDDAVRIRVINKNRSSINRGNDFGLDGIRFEAITTRSSNVEGYEVFPVKYLLCEILDANFDQRQAGSCGATTANVDFTVKYRNPRGDFYIYEGATKLAQISNSEFTDPNKYFGTIAGRPLDGNVHEYTIYFKDALVQTDAPTVYKDTAHKMPAIIVVSTEWIAPACGATTCTLRAVVSYTNQNGTLSANVDGGTAITPSYIVENDTAKTITIDIPGVIADGKTGHKLNISYSGSHGCSIANYNILAAAPKGNTITAFAVEAIEPACDGTTYQLRATWSVTKAAVEGSVYDRLIIADKDGEMFTTLKTITITSENATDGTVVLDEAFAVATLSHPTIVAYLEERGKTCYTAAADYDHPVVPAMTIGTPTFEAISCNKSTFNMVVPVTYTNQHGKMWAWIDSRTKMEVTIDTNCKTGGEYKGYKADETTERTTYIVFTDLELSGDHTVSVECDGTGSCHRTNAVLPDASRLFTAPLLPKAEMVTPISFPSVAACDQATFDLTLSIKFTYQDGNLQAWVDGNSPATFYTPSESAGEGKYIKRSTEQTKSITLTGLPADGGTAHTLYYKFNAEGFCGYSTPLEFDLPDFPQSPTVTSTTVTSVPSRVACDASSHTATVNVVFKNGKGKKIVIENEDGTVIHTSTDAMASDNDTYSTSVSLSDIDGDSHYVRAYFLGYGSCKTTDAHKGTYTAPVQASISDVAVASVSETDCNTTNYTISGTVTFANAVSGKKLIVWYDASHKQEISSPASPQAFSIGSMTATGSALTVEAYFEDDPSACHVTSNTFAAPTVPTMTIKNVHQSTPGCDDLTYNLDFDVDYVYQHGDLTVHVGSYGDTVVSIPVANRAQTSTLTAHVTYSGKIPADGSTKTLYAAFGGANSCSDTKTLAAVLSPVITDMSVSVPTTPIACDATSYPASVTVNTQYAIGKKIVIVYKNKADEDVELGTHVVASSPESYPFTGLSFTDIGATGTRSVLAYLDERDGCVKSKNYSIPPTTSIDSPFDVDIVDKSTCSGVKYDLSGSITYSSKPDGVDPAVRFGAYDATMTNITASGADFAFTNVTTVGTDMHVEAYFENKPLCSVSSATFSSPLKPDFEVLSQSMATPDCDVTTTTLTFDIRYTKQPSGTLTVWVDDTEIGKHTVDYTPNASSETPTTIEDVTVAGIPADGKTHTLHVNFAAGCGERTYTTPATLFSPAISGQAVAISNESCDADTYTATVTFTVANGQGKNVTVSGKGKTITKAAVEGTNTFVFSGANAIARTLATTTDDYFEIYFPDASASCPHKTAAYTEKPKPQLVEIELGADPVVDCFDDSYTLTGKLYYTNINAAPRVWLDDVASDAAKTTLTYVAGQSDTKNTAFSLTIPADGRSHVIHADIVGWDASCAIEEDYTAIWSPVVTGVTPTLLKSYVHCNETYSVTLSISYARGLSGKKIYASCSDHGETISGNAALATGSSTASITLTGLKETDHTDHPLSLYFEGLASCPITSFDYDEPHVKAITLDAITSNDVNCGDPSFSITGKVAANVAGEKIIISDGFGHSAEVTPAEANTKYSYTITGLTAEGSVKAQFEDVACSETAAQPFANVTLKPIPTVSITSIGNECDYIDETTVHYTTTDASTYKYYILGKTPLSSAQTAETSGSFTLDISMLTAGTYTLKMVANNATCKSDTTTRTFTVYPKPTIAIGALSEPCDDATSMTIPYTSTDAATYRYYIVGKTPLSSAQTAAESSSFTLDISALDAGTYTLKMVANSANCVSDTATKTITIHPLPTFTLSTAEADSCYPTPEIVVSYTSTNASKYSYTLTKSGALSPSLNVSDQTASASGTITMNTTGLASGTYTLSVTAVSGKGCNIATPATKTIEILKQPTVSLTDIDDICEKTASVATTLTLTDAAKYDYTVIKEGSATPVDSKINQTATTLTLTTSTWTKGTYTLQVTAISSAGCSSVTKEKVFRIYPQPKVADLTNATICEKDVTVSFTYTMTDAKTYTYVLKNSSNVAVLTQSTPQTVAAGGTGTITFNPSALRDGTYTLYVTATSDNDCVSDAKSSTLTIKNKPSLTISDIAPQCYPIASFTITYTPKDVKYVKWTVDSKITDEQTCTVPNTAPYEFAINTSEWAAGTYTLRAYPVSALDCDSAAVVKTFTIYPQPVVNTLADATICEGTASATFAYTMSAIASTYSYELKNSSNETVASKTNEPASTSGSITITTSLLADGTYTLHVTAKSVNGCESTDKTSTLTVNNKPELSLGAIAAQCYPATSFTIGYTPTDATKLRYSVDGKVGATELTIPAALTINTSDWAAGDYTLRVTPISSHGCEGTEVTGTIKINAKPTASIATIANKCDNESSTLVEYSTTNAATYKYYIDGVTSLSDPETASTSGSFSLDIDGLDAGDYTLKLIAYSEAGCESAVASKGFTVYPLPTFTLSTAEVRDCHPSTSISVGYTSTDTKTYNYTLTLAGESTPDLSESDKVASASGTIVLNTTGLAAGTYSLAVQAFSEHACTMAAEATKTITIQAKPTVTINSVESHCKANATINVSYSTTHATTYYYEVFGTDLKGHADAAGIGSFTIDISTLAASTYTLQMKATSGTCESIVDEKPFTIYPIPAVTFDTPAPIRSDVTSVDVTIHLSDATNYDYRFIDKDGSTELDSQTGIAAANTTATVTLNTTGLGEGHYTLFVTPKSATCVGQESSVTVVINNKPSINFTEPAAVCKGATAISIAYGKSDDAEKLTYSISKGGTPVVSSTDLTLASNPSSLTFNISGWEYGTYTLTGKVSYEALDHSIVEGDESSVDFTILADLSVASVSQPVTYIGCGESYSATIVVNLLNAAGRTIHAKYVDDNTEYTPSRSTSVGDATATFVLSGLKDTGHSSHSASIYVDGYESCGITATYAEPTLKTLTLGAPTLDEVHCGDAAFSISGSLTSNFAGETVVISDGNGHFTNVTSAVGDVPYTITGLTASGTITAKFVGYDCSETAAQPYTVTALRPIPTLTLAAITAQCYPTESFVVAYNHTDAADIKFTVKQGETIKQAETTVAVNTEKQFTVNTSGWQAGTYTIDAYAVSAGNCTSTHSQQSFTIHPKPAASITSMESKCVGSATATLAFTTTNATQYQYCIEGKTGWSSKAAIAASYDVPVASLPVGDYKIRLVAHSATCVSDTADAIFHIYPLPTFTLASAVAEDCHPSTSISVDYTSTDAKTYSYTLILSGESTPALSETDQVASASGTIVLNTTGLAAGTYTLAVQAVSEYACNMAAEVTKTVTIHPKPTASITSMESKCVGSAIATLAFTTNHATEYQYCIEGQTDWSPKASIVASYDVPVASLPVGDYKIRLVAHSATCVSDTADATFHIYPLPTFTLASAVAEDCYPSTSISVDYTSTDAKTYSYTLTLAGESTAALTVTNQDASPSGAIVLNTTGLAAGTYTLAVQAVSEHACNMAAEVTKTVTIHPKPTVTINSVTNPCKDEGIISVNYSSTYASEYTYAIVGTTLAGNGTAAPTETFTIDISSLTPGLYKLQMTTSSTKCTSLTAEYPFTIYPVPAVTFDTPAPIRSDVTSVDITIHLTDATSYDYRFIDKNGSTVLDSQTGIVAANTTATITLNTTGRGEGNYTLFVTPKSATCVGQESSVTVVINNKPSIVFTEPAAVCIGTTSLNIEYMTSSDAKQFTYAITTKAGAPKQAATTVNLSDYPSSQTIDISTWEYGTYTLTGHVSYSAGGITVTGDESSVDFTILADLSVASVSQPLNLIGCEENYATTVVVNLLNNAGRTIHAKCTDDTNHEVSASVATAVGDPTATLVLAGLKDVNHTAHTVSIYVDGYESCGISTTYDEPTLMVITPDFTAEPQRKDCDETVFTIKGKVLANCNTGNIVVEYDDTYKVTVAASTTGSDYVISNIPTGGSITQLKAYFDGKTCGIVNSAVFAELPMPEASVVSVTPVAPPCDTATFTLHFDLSYIYQPGDLTVWLDSLTADKALYSKTIATTHLSSTSVALHDSLVGLPADGSTGHVLHYQFAGEHACGGAQVGTFAFPKTPLIKGVSVVKDVEYIEGLTGEYYPTVTVTYEKANGQIIVLEYFDKDNNPKYAESSPITSDAEGSYIFDKTSVTGWSFDDVTMGNRVVHAYFKVLACTSGGTHDGHYTAPTNCSIKFESINTPTNKSTCDSPLYDISGKVSFVGAALGDLIVELTIDGTTFSGKIDNAQCIADTQLPFVIENINKAIPDEGVQLTAYFFDLPANTTISADKVYTPAIPSINVVSAVYTKPECNVTTDSLIIELEYKLQNGDLHLYFGSDEQNYTIDPTTPLILGDDTKHSSVITIADLPADLSVRTLRVQFDGANSCDRSFPMPTAPFSPRITNVKVDTVLDVRCGVDDVTLVVSYDVENGQNATATIKSKDISVTRQVTDGHYADTLRNVPRTYTITDDDTVMVSIPATYCIAALTNTYEQLPKPEVIGVSVSPVAPSCDTTTFTLRFDLTYIYQSGDLIVWLDSLTADKALYKKTITIDQRYRSDVALHDSLVSLPANGSAGHVLHYQFDGEHACDGVSGTFAFPVTPLITGTDIDNANIPQVVPGVDEPYDVTVKVTYELAIGERIVLEYFNKDDQPDQPQHAYSDSVVTGNGSYEFHLTFNDVAVTGERIVNAYFEGSECKTGGTHTDTYTAPSNSSAKFESLVLTNTGSCDTLLYDLTGTVSFIGEAVGDLIVEFDANHTYTIPEASCVAGENIPFAITGVDVPIPAEGQELKVYFADLPNNKSYSAEVYQPVIPTMAISDSAYSTPACNSTLTTLTFNLTYLKQQGDLHVAVDEVEQDYTLSDDLSLNDETTRTVTVTVADQPADSAVRQLTVWFDGERSCSRTLTLPKAPFGPQITGGNAVASNFTCGSDVYDVTVTVTTANHLNQELTLICHDQTKVVTVIGSPMSVLFTDIYRTIGNTSDDFVELYFADASNAAGCASDHMKITYVEPAKPTLDAEVKVDSSFTCGSKQYELTVTVTSENQPGTCYVLDSIAGGVVDTVAKYDGSYSGSKDFTIALPATNEQHFVVVRYPATSCEVISSAIDINTYTKPKPLISLTAIDRLCNSEMELLLPFAITQGDIDEATLTLTNSKGTNVITAADMLINDSKDTLSYTLLSQLAAGKYTISVEARDTLDCVTTATLPVELAQDGVVFSKWTDVLLVDNAEGIYTSYQWYENGQALEGQTGQMLYLPEGMDGLYTCLLTTAEGQFYTCEYAFADIPRSADHQRSSNHITVLPNRVQGGGLVTVHQSEPEELYIILLTATGQWIAELTQTESLKSVEMPTIQGVYLMRIEAEDSVEMVKIIVY